MPYKLLDAAAVRRGEAGTGFSLRDRFAPLVFPSGFPSSSGVSHAAMVPFRNEMVNHQSLVQSIYNGFPRVLTEG